MIFNKENPSSEYLKLLKNYQTIHKKGTANRSPKDTYNGLSTINFADILKKIINKNNCKTLFDYGSGKGDRYFNNSLFVSRNILLYKIFGKLNLHFLIPVFRSPGPTIINYSI